MNKFTCPVCGSHQLNVVEKATQVSLINIEDDGIITTGDLQDSFNEGIVSINCDDCRYVVKNKYNQNIVNYEDLAKWLENPFTPEQ